MSSDWIKARAQQIKNKDSQERSDKDWNLYAEREIKSKAPALWKRTVDLTLTFAREFNASFPEKERRMDTIQDVPRGVLLHRSYYPAVRIRAEYFEDRQVLAVSIVRTKDQSSNPSEETSEHYPILQSDGVILWDGSTDHESLARSFVEPFFADL